MSCEKRPHFLLGFDPSFSSESLEIPRKFAKLIYGEVPGVASLLGPSGRTWRANIVLLNGEICFQNGWDIFVRDNSLELGDSLVFRYDGNLCFSVLVFDQSKCEKEAACSFECRHDSRNLDNHLKKRERENSAPVNDILEGIPKRIRSSLLYSECISIDTNSPTHRKNSPIISEFISSKKNAESHSDFASKKGFPEEISYVVRQSGVMSMANEQNNVDCALRNLVTIAIPSQGSVVIADSEATMYNRTEKEEFLSPEEADRLARSFTSSFPNFTTVMKKFNISGSYTLNIPYQFATAHLPKCKVKVVLHNGRGESWTINSVPTIRVQTSHTFCGGWLSFVRDNNIGLGDICIFELVGECEMRVQVIRVMKETAEGHSENEMEKVTSRSSCQVTNRTSRRKMKSRNDHKIHLQWPERTATSKNTSLPLPSKCTELVVWEASTPGRFGSHTKGCVSMKSGPEEKLAAQSFLSKLPHFVRIMKNFNVSGSYTLKIPYRFSMEHLPNCRTEITLRNLKGKCWTVNSITTTKVQTLHTFCGGWMAFVRDNKIQIGDICIFELVGKHEMRVHVSRPVVKESTCLSERASSDTSP